MTFVKLSKHLFLVVVGVGVAACAPAPKPEPELVLPTSIPSEQKPAVVAKKKLPVKKPKPKRVPKPQAPAKQAEITLGQVQVANPDQK